MKDNYCIGINMGLHDSSAALLKNGKLLVMGEQERFSRNKRANGEAPIDAVQFCLDEAEICLDDVAYIALGSSQELLDKWHELTEEEIAKRVRLDDPNRLFPKNIFNYKKLPPMISVPHHIAHAASAFYPSGYDEAAILVVDNRGENAATSLYFGKDNHIKLIKQFPITESLGLYYRIASQYAGLCGKNRNVGKLMGLAAYGKPTENVALKIVGDQVSFEETKEMSDIRGIELADKITDKLLQYFQNHCFPYAKELVEDVMAYSNFACSVQNAVEKALLRYCEILKEETNAKNLVIAGGVGLNCSANGKIAASGLYENIFVQPVAGDAGVSIGAAMHVSNEKNPEQCVHFKMNHAYYGKQYSTSQIVDALDKYSNLDYQILDERQIAYRSAKFLFENKVIGWFHGRAEIGPRALGARSILGNPMYRSTLVKINQIKQREIWRPLAPSVMEEFFHDYFIGTHGSPFMIVATEVRREQRSKIPAVVHIDGSARPQVVSRNTNRMYWELINEFNKIAGIPIILNTSFNCAEEPIVHTPENAIEDFLRTSLDVLVLENVLIVKEAG